MDWVTAPRREPHSRFPSPKQHGNALSPRLHGQPWRNSRRRRLTSRRRFTTMSDLAPRLAFEPRSERSVFLTSLIETAAVNYGREDSFKMSRGSLQSASDSF